MAPAQVPSGAHMSSQQPGKPLQVFAPLSVLWTYASLKDLAPRGGPSDLSPAEIRIRCLKCNVQWIATRGTPGTAVGEFEHVNGHVRLICPGCKAEGEIEVSRLTGGDDDGPA